MKSSRLEFLFEAQQFTPEIILELFQIADGLEQKIDPILKGKLMASLFYEPSTRTRLSFESAMHRLGGNVIGTENAASFSSASKGETLEDTIRVVSNYADVIVLRYFEKDIAERLANIATVPIINAGDGAGQHPTQALLDLYTVNRECGRMDDLDVVAIGDLKNGRTIRSFVYLLSKYPGIKFTFVSPEGLEMEPDIKDYLKKHDVPFMESENLFVAMKHADVVYQTRIQKERLSAAEDPERFRGQYAITRALADSMKEGAIIMHPLPRNKEIACDVDTSPHAVYFKQPHYGLLIRMAILVYLFR